MNDSSKTRRVSRLSLIGSGKEMEYFTENLSLLLMSGMNLSTAIRAIISEIRSKPLKKVLENLLSEVEGGAAISTALEQSGLLPSYVISLIKIGEKSETLSENLKTIAAQQQEQRVLKSRIRSAMMYPAIVVSLTVVIGLGVAWFILPRLAMVFSGLKVELPLLTRILLGLGKFLSSYGYIVVPLIIVLVFSLIYFLFFNRKTNSLGQKILLSTPGISRLVKEVEISRFGHILGTLLNTGLPIVQAVTLLNDTTTFHSYSEFFSYLKTSFEDGNSFQKSFAGRPGSSKLIPGPVQQMIVSAEQSGNLPKTLLKIGEIYAGKSEITTKNLSTMLEPILLIIVWLGVLMVALAIIVPIYSLIGSIKK